MANVLKSELIDVNKLPILLKLVLVLFQAFKLLEEGSLFVELFEGGPVSIGVEDEFELVVVEGVFGDVVLIVVTKVVGRGEHRIEAHPQYVLYHVGDQPLQDRGGQLQAGVGVDLDQPGLEVLVHHEIQPKQLEVLVPVLPIKGNPGGLHSHAGNFLHFWDQDVVQVENPSEAGQPIEVPLQLVEAKLIALLEVAVAVSVDLDGVVGEVDVGIGVVEAEEG